ncbi:unnamed protein product, partial [Owenia fusiformis]
AVVVGVSLGVTKLEGYGTDQYCWLSIDKGVIFAFVGPALGVVMVNFVFLILVFRGMFGRKRSTQKKTNIEKFSSGVWSLCILLPILGLTWLFGVFSINEETIIFQYL